MAAKMMELTPPRADINALLPFSGELVGVGVIVGCTSVLVSGWEAGEGRVLVAPANPAAAEVTDVEERRGDIVTEYSETCVVLETELVWEGLGSWLGEGDTGEH